MRVGGTMTTYYIYMATHPDGSRYYGLTSKGLKYAKEQHRLSSYNSGGHTSYTGLSLYAYQTKTPVSKWRFTEVYMVYDRALAFKLKRSLVEVDPVCLNIKYKHSYRRFQHDI